MKVKFDLNKWLADKSQKVVTREGYAVTIGIWQMNAPKPIVGCCQYNDEGDETAECWYKNGSYSGVMEHPFDLFLLRDEEELTEFEATLLSYLSDDTSGELDKETMHRCVKARAEELLAIARKQIEKECWDKFQKASNSELDWIAAIPDSVKYDEGWKDGYRLGKYEGERNARFKQMGEEKKRKPGPALTEIVENLTPEKLEKTKQEMEESDDERIREWVYNYFSPIGKTWLYESEMPLGSILAWLEKQKDSVPNAKYIEDIANAFEDGRKKEMEEFEENTCGACCDDERFEIIAQAKKDIIEKTNIAENELSMELPLLDGILMRVWQVGWLNKKPADLPAGFYLIAPDGKKYYSKEFWHKLPDGYVSLKLMED